MKKSDGVVVTYINEELRDKLKAEAIKQDISMSKLMKNIITKYYTDHLGS